MPSASKATRGLCHTAKRTGRKSEQLHSCALWCVVGGPSGAAMSGEQGPTKQRPARSMTAQTPRTQLSPLCAYSCKMTRTELCLYGCSATTRGTGGTRMPRPPGRTRAHTHASSDTRSGQRAHPRTWYEVRSSAQPSTRKRAGESPVPEVRYRRRAIIVLSSFVGCMAACAKLSFLRQAAFAADRTHGSNE